MLNHDTPCFPGRVCVLEVEIALALEVQVQIPARNDHPKGRRGSFLWYYVPAQQ